LYDCIGDKSDHTIKDFLSRPVILQQGVWADTDARGAVLANMIFPKNLFDTTPLTSSYKVLQNINKLDGFVALKARVRVRIEVNSQPFQAGALMMHYVPYSEYMNSHTQWYSTSTVTDTIAASGCPHVTMNLANTTAMEFTTPYVSPYLYFNLATGQGSFGNVVISVLSPIASVASTTANYTIWANFEEVELCYPTDAPLTTIFAQSGNEVAKLHSRGSISSTVGSVGNAIADVLPWVGLGWLSAPTRMIGSAGEKTLKMLGFSKPSVEAPVTSVKQMPTQYFMNSDGADSSHKLGLSAANALSQFSGWAGTDDDEMRLDVISARPCLSTTFHWKTSQAADTSIFLQPVSPLHTQTLVAAVAGRYARPTSLPLCAKVASQFAMWRGTMVYKFKVVKTQFHSGRLRISFRPYAYADSTTIQNMPAYAFTEDIDLAAGSDFTFEVPFVAVRPWLQTNYDPATAIASSDIRNVATGVVQISVINPLVSASTVATTVEVLVFASMKDAQFSAPILTPFLPYNIPNVAQSGLPEAQSGRARVVKTESDSSLVSSHQPISVFPSSSCAGEVVTSYRQLLKRSSYLGSLTLNAFSNASTAGGTGQGFVLYPWAPVIPQNGAFAVSASGALTPKYTSTYSVGSTTPQSIIQNVDTYSSLYSLFAFYRGSIRIKLVISKAGTNYDAKMPINIFVNNLVSAVPETWRQPMLPNVAAGAGASNQLGSGPIQALIDAPFTTVATLKAGFAYSPGFAEFKTVAFPDKDGIIEFEVPYHSTGHMCPTNYGLDDNSTARSIVYPIPTVTITGPTLLGSTIDIYRSVGDDFSFGGLLGCPKHALWSRNKDPV